MFFECSGMARADSLPITQVVSSVREIRRRSDGHVKPGYDSHDLGRYLHFCSYLVHNDLSQSQRGKI